MNPDIQRARFYMNQRRYKEAQAELAKAIADQPDNSLAHTMLAFCLHRSGDRQGSRKAAAQGVSLDPASAYAHRMLGHISFEQGDQKTAEQAIREAIRLQPYDANAYGLLALSLASSGKWKESLAAAESGLGIDPNEVNCVNARSQALSVIGGKADTQRAVQAALQQNSQDPLAQTYAGWAMLRQGNSKQALDHFREALRLDPNRDDARRGMVEALRARFPVYRLLISWATWLQRFPPGGRRALIFGLYFVFRGSIFAAETNPEIRPVVFPIAGAYILFALFTWIGGPLMNIMLLAHPLGRIALTRAERIETTALAVLLGSTLACLAIGLIVHKDLPLYGAASGGIGIILVSLLSRAAAQKGKTAVVCGLAYLFVLQAWVLTVAAFISS